MVDDIHNLVLSPFRDIVSKGNQALENATLGGSESMIKAAQSLLNNAGRALKRIEPVCERQFNEHHSVFISALKENDDITHFREQLNDTIWDLDDSLDVDTFNPEIYTKLQTLLRTSALKISDIVVRMKLEQRQQQHPSLPETPITPISERPRTPSIIVSPSPVHSTMEAKAGPIQGWEEGEGVSATVMARHEITQPAEESDSPTIKTNAPTILLEPVPPEPREDPWRGPTSENLTLHTRSLSTEDAAIQRRPRMSFGGQSDGEPVSPLTPDTERATPPFKHSPSSSRDNIVSPLDEDPRSSFIIPPEALSKVTASQQSRILHQEIDGFLERYGDELASPSSIYSEYAGEPTRKIPSVPDSEGLIPVEHEHGHDPNSNSNSHPNSPSQVLNQSPTVLITSTHNRVPPPKLKADNNSSEDPVPPILELIPRTTITNVSFPAQYSGEWALGWHPINQTRGLFPLDCVSIQMPLSEDAAFFRGAGGSGGGERNPPESGGFINFGRRKERSASSSSGGEISGNSGNGDENNNTAGLNGLSAVARWSFSGSGSSGSFTFGTATLKKDKDVGSSNEQPPLQWLKFSKGEVITGICFPYPHHWCWAGYNAKNKWGIFPRAFMTPGTLIKEAPSSLLQLLHREGTARPSQNNRPTTSPAGISSALFSRLSSKGLPLPLGLRRLSGGTGGGAGGDSGVSGSPTTTTTSSGGASNNNKTGRSRGDTGSSSSGGSGSGSGFLESDWARRPSDGEPTPDSPSGSFYTHTRAPSGGGGITSAITKSPRPSLY